MGFRNINNADDLASIHRAGRGFIFNRFDRRVHAAACDQVDRMGPKNKTFAEDEASGRAFLESRGSSAMPFSRCNTCSYATPPTLARAVAPAGVEAAASTAEPSYDIATGERQVVADSDVHVPFEPRAGSTAAALRAALRSGLAHMKVTDTELIHAVFTGPLPPQADLENLLLYNIFDGTAARVAMRRGVRFEHRPSDPSAPRRLRLSYDAADGDAGFRHWTPGDEVARFSGVAIPAGADKLLARVWSALQSADVNTSAPLADDARFAVKLHLAAPEGATPVGVDRLKQLFDAVIARFQRWPPPAPDVVERLAATLGLGEERILALMSDDTHAVLGPSLRAVAPFRDSVQWHPDDTRLVAAELVVKRADADGWTLSGAAHGILPRTDV